MQDNTDNTEARASTTAVVFIVAGHPYAVAAERTREVLGWREPRQLPGSDAWIEGVINLRGAIIPVCDLAQALGLRGRLADASAASIVIVEAGSGNECVGFTVDEVRSVTSFDSSWVVDAPGIDHPAMAGIVRMDGELVVLLDPARALAGAALDALHVEASKIGDAASDDGPATERDAA